MSPNTAVPSIFDLQSLSALKKGAKDADPKALKAAAQQFEALFLQMVLKSMRDATPRESMFDSEQSRLYESLLDQQLAQVMASRNGTGLAAMIERQLARPTDAVNEPLGALPLQREALPHTLDRGAAKGLPLVPTETGGYPVDGAFNAAPPVPPATSGTPAVGPISAAADALPPGAREFVGRVWPHAVEVSRATGIPAHFMVAQAALETGWGKSEPRQADGSPSFNLFGIKAGRLWSGPVVEAQTTEFIDGSPQRRTERFRAYASYGEAFRDYAELLSSSPRYAGVVGTQDAASFARSLQQAGYATDPMYAVKLERIIGGPTLRSALAG